MAGSDLIDEYVAAVGGRLRGSRRLRADMLTEIRDALVDAAGAAEDCGVRCVEARRQAVAEFGAAEKIAAGLQGVLAFVQARRTGWGLLGVLGARHLIAELSGRSGLWNQWWSGVHPGLGYTLLSRMVDGLALTCLILSAVTVVVFGRAAHRFEPPRIGVRVVAVGTPIALGLTLAGGLLLTALAPSGWTALGPVLLGTAWWLVPFALVLRSAWRCWQAAGA